MPAAEIGKTARLVILGLVAAAIAQAAQEPRTPVVVELFTSEGCSSCPAADDLLSKLAKLQPVDGADIIALSENVDYWNRLGWTDPFSSPQFTARQQRYASVFRAGGAYTPQMVVDGQVELVGSDGRRALQAIAGAARKSKVPVTLECRSSGTALELAVRLDQAPREDSDVLLAITESGLASDVRRGENAGRRMLHDGVVRRLEPIGRVRREAFRARPAVQPGSGWKRENLAAVVLVQDRASRRIVGAARVVTGACLAN